MRILEGLLPVEQTMSWTSASAPFVACGLPSSQILIRVNPPQGTCLGNAAAFSRPWSALKRPSVTLVGTEGRSIGITSSSI
jgi:ABC-type Co2+ transport system permease subunit